MEDRMKRLTDEELKQRIAKRKEGLDRLLALEQERNQARRVKIAEHLECRYGVTTIQQLDQLLAPLQRREEE